MSVTNAVIALCRIANDLRLAGDVRLVLMDSDGVAPAAISLADELWLIAFSLDGDIAMSEARRVAEAS